MQFKVSKSCLLCWKPFAWNEVFIIKAPEWACFHTECCNKFPDENTYKMPDAWIVHEFQWEEIFTCIEVEDE